MLNLQIHDQPGFKKKFRNKFLNTKLQCPEFASFINKLTENNTAFVVGGFLRDIQLGRESRDIDIIIDQDEAELEKAVNSMNLHDCKKNRLGGYKLLLKGLTVDFWSVEANWAFKNRLVKHSEKYILDRIGKGCFYNFDSLVIDIKTLGLNVKSYNSCIEKNMLDILMVGRLKYKNSNPTQEANLVRAFYLKKQFGFDFSEELYIYLKRMIYGMYGSKLKAVEKLLLVLNKYEKYKIIVSPDDIEQFVHEIKFNEAAFSAKWKK